MLSTVSTLLAVADLTEVNPGLTFWTLVTFVVVGLLLRQVAWDPILKLVEDREKAIVDAIALDHMEAFQEALMARLMLAFPPDAPSFLAAVIDGFVAYLDLHPDFRTLAFGQGPRTISAATRDAYAVSGEMLATLREVLAVRLPALKRAWNDALAVLSRRAVEVATLYADTVDPRVVTLLH